MVLSIGRSITGFHTKRRKHLMADIDPKLVRKSVTITKALVALQVRSKTSSFDFVAYLLGYVEGIGHEHPELGEDICRLMNAINARIQDGPGSIPTDIKDAVEADLDKNKG